MKKLMLLFLLCGCGLTYNEPEPKVLPKYPDYLKTADAFNRFDERKDRQELKAFLGVDPVQYEWCAAFVNAVLRVNNVPGSESVNDNPLMARSFLDWGEPVDEPRLGDIVVFPRGNSGWQGHVGFYIMTDTIDDVTYYVILGGNQDNMVTYDIYPASSALDVRRMPE